MGRRHARRTKQNDQSNYHEQNEHSAQSETAAQAAEEEKDLRPVDIPETVWAVYQQTFLEFDEKEQRRIVKGCEKQIGQLERRIARKKNQENHQVLADMKELHKKAAAIGR